MNEELWSTVDRYLERACFVNDPALDRALETSAAAGMPTIAVSPCQGMLLHLMAKAAGAERILEIGTLGGYSGIWLARALPPDGRLVTLEADPGHAAIARRNFERAGVSDRIDLCVGRAQETLPRIESEGLGPFDLIFVDADKPAYTEYLDWSIRLARPGTVIVVDNIVRDGAVADPNSRDEKVQGVRRFNEALARETRVTATALQLVGAKGYDGFAVMIVNAA